MSFVGGGPVRIFLHITLNMLTFQVRRPEHFRVAIELLGYLLLRKRGSFFVRTVDESFSVGIVSS